MTRWWPVFRREVGAALRAPSLSIFAALFFTLLGVLLNQALNLFTDASLGDRAVHEGVFESQILNINDVLAADYLGITLILLIFSIPFLTMRLVADEKRSGTYDLLMSYPLREVDVVIGKFLAVWLTTALILTLTLVHVALLWWASDGRLEIAPVLVGYLGLLFAAGCFAAVGLFASCLTENQLVAGLLTFGLLILGLVVGSLAPDDSGLLAATLRGLDIFEHSEHFLRGVLRVGDLSHFAVVGLTALYLASQALAFRRLGVIR